MSKSNMKPAGKTSAKENQLKSSKKSTLSAISKRLASNHNEILLRGW